MGSELNKELDFRTFQFLKNDENFVMLGLISMTQQGSYKSGSLCFDPQTCFPLNKNKFLQIEYKPKSNQFLNLKNYSCVMFSRTLALSPKSKQIPTNSPISEHQITSLKNYHRYLHHEMKYLELEFQKDEAELELVYLKLSESQGILEQNKILLYQELSNLKIHLESELQIQSQLEVVNLNNINELRVQYLEQEQALIRQKQMRNEGHNLIHLINAFQIQEQRIARVSSLNRQISQTEQIISEVREKIGNDNCVEALLIEKLKSIEKQGQEKKQALAEGERQYLKMLAKIQMKQQEISNEKQKKLKTEQKMESLRVKTKEMALALLNQESEHHKMIKIEKGILCELQNRCKELEVEERGREKETDEYRDDLIRKEQYSIALGDLRQYSHSIVQNNMELSSILNQYKSYDQNIAGILLSGHKMKQLNKIQKMYSKLSIKGEHEQSGNRKNEKNFLSQTSTLSHRQQFNKTGGTDFTKQNSELSQPYSQPRKARNYHEINALLTQLENCESKYHSRNAN